MTIEEMSNEELIIAYADAVNTEDWEMADDYKEEILSRMVE